METRPRGTISTCFGAAQLPTRERCRAMPAPIGIRGRHGPPVRIMALPTAGGDGQAGRSAYFRPVAFL